MDYIVDNTFVRNEKKVLDNETRYVMKSDFKDLFRPSWNSWREDKAVEAVKKLTNEAKLVRAAKKARCREARIKAIEKLTNQTVLTFLAKYDWDRIIRLEAIEKVNDQKILVEIARNDPSNEVRLAAFKRSMLLVNNIYNTLNEIAIYSKYINVRDLRDGRLTEQTRWIDISLHSS